MPHQYKLRQAAKQNLEDIAVYTEEKWGREKRNEYLHELGSRFEWLAKNPDLGKPQEEIKPGYYSYPQGSHIIFYIIKKDHIEIIGILHKRMLPEHHI
ncbi:MAG: type II toxin-antitoxin system RelE/ParE family toxin [Cellvibrionaceae bacterium]|nr:type II toxin-antitoxin system RelE/ParE family toxin [Cellvibrionaceae bacterium]